MTETDLAAWLRPAKHLTVLTGAGMSAESGIPTFRDALSGLWERFSAEELATPEGFQRDPELVWGWYEWRRMRVMETRPNPGHLALAQLAAQGKKITVITQNVDDLHERAGSAPVLHLHGNLSQARCFDCGHRFAHPANPPREPEGGRRLTPPKCERCGGHIRPAVVWFGESLPMETWERAEQAIRQCDATLVIGTSGLVQPAAGLPLLAKQLHKPVAQLNPGPTELDPYMDLNVREPASYLAEVVDS